MAQSCAILWYFRQVFKDKIPSSGTLLVNVIGCLLIGVLAHWPKTARCSGRTPQLLIVGILGAFTTFSTFGYESVVLLKKAPI